MPKKTSNELKIISETSPKIKSDFKKTLNSNNSKRKNSKSNKIIDNIQKKTTKKSSNTIKKSKSTDIPKSNEPINSKLKDLKDNKLSPKNKSSLTEELVNIDNINSNTKLTQPINIVEYYDLPYRYNQTIIKVLAQTPTTLFVYWDISDNDRINFINMYGKDFFNYTKPVLIIHNITKNYSFEIEINDFANSWYFNVNDSNCEYSVELGRRKKYNSNNNDNIHIPNNYLYIASSNIMDAPNDHVLLKNFNTNTQIYFKNTKTNKINAKALYSSTEFIKSMHNFYKTNNFSTEFNDTNSLKVDLSNPSSTSSLTFK